MKTISNTFTVNTVIDGDDAAMAFATPAQISIPCYSNGNVKAQKITSVTFSLKVGTNTATVTRCAVGTKPTGVTVQGQANNAVTITVGTSATASGLSTGVTFTVTGTYGGKTYSATITVALIGSTQGEQGERGKVGRFFYFGGTFNAADTTQTFIVNDAQAPYFEHTVDGQKRYHVFNYDTNGTYTMAQMWSIKNNWNSKPWESMTNDFKYIITEALFANNAKLGSFIVSGDWLISTNGTINGTAYVNGASYYGAPAYTWFDPAYPNTDHTKKVTIGGGQQVTVHNFIPNLAFDGRTGTTYQQDAHVKGEIIATSGSFTGVVRAAMMYGTQLTVNNPNTSVKKYALDLVNHPANLFMCDPTMGNLVIVLPQAGDYDGITIRFFANGVTASNTVTLQTYNSSVNLYFKDMDNYVVGSWQHSNAMKMLKNEPYEASAINGVWYITQGIGKYGTYVS